MTNYLDFLMAVLVVTTLMLVGTSRLSRSVYLLALQGAVIAFLPPLVEKAHATIAPWYFTVIVVGLKSLLIPVMLLLAIRKAGVRQEHTPMIGYAKSFLVAAILFIGSRVLAARLPFPSQPVSELIVPAAFFMFATGLFLIVSRVTAISQVLGYLLMENGIFVFGMAHSYSHSFLVEVAILLDVFAAVMVMGIAIYQINLAFDHIDTHRLTNLRDFRR